MNLHPKFKSRLLFLMAISLMLSGCATPLFEWGNYHSTLHQYLETPQERETFIKGLQEIIIDAEKSGKVPPGIYGEYGYALLESGQHNEAIRYFNKERKRWPESRHFMSKMIRNVEQMNTRSKGVQ